MVVAPDGLAFTRLCLESVLLNADDVDLELVVVDNGTTDGTREYLAALAERDSRVVVLRNDENRGFGPAVNQGLARGHRRRARRAQQRHDRSAGLALAARRPISTAPRSASSARPRTAAATRPRSTLRIAPMVKWSSCRRGEQSSTRGVAFDIEVATLFCAAMRRDVFERVGSLDERFEVGLFEDDDYSERVRAAGYRVVCAEDAFVHHFGEASFGELVSTGRYGELFRANKARFEEKWGVSGSRTCGGRTRWYRDLVERIREVVDRELPRDATVLVVSNGDDELLQLGASRRGWHFPQMEDGTYAGYHPGDQRGGDRTLRGAQDRGAPSTSSFPRRRPGGSSTTPSSPGACIKVLLRSLLLGYAAYSASIRAPPAEQFRPRQAKSPGNGCDGAWPRVSR